MDPVFNKFKEKLGSFKKALSKTIEKKAVAIEYEAEQAPENEEVPVGELEPVLEETDFVTSLREESPEIEHIESVTATPINVDKQDKKKAEYQKRVKREKKRQRLMLKKKKCMEIKNLRRKNPFSKRYRMLGLRRRQKLWSLIGKSIWILRIWKSLYGNSKWVF